MWAGHARTFIGGCGRAVWRFRAEPAHGGVTKGRRAAEPPGQPHQVLTLLLERPGHLVTRDELRRHLWPDDTFGDFEHGLNAVVNRLRDTLGDSADTPRFIETLPRRGYRFIGTVESTLPPTEIVQPQAVTALGRDSRLPLFRGKRQVVVLVAIAVVAVVVWWSVQSPPPSQAAAMRLVPITTLTGQESWPTFSPDGEQVAFDWSGEKGDNDDIYVTMVGSSEVRRLTTDSAIDTAPSWSPDGRQIAFLRCQPLEHGCQIRLVSPLGGSDSKLSDMLVSPGLAWSRDSRVIAAAHETTNADHGDSGIYVFPRGGGEPRAITLTKPTSEVSSPALSPDGRRLAYASCESGIHGPFGCDVNLLEVDSDLGPIGLSRRLTLQAMLSVSGLTWTRDGASVIFDGDDVNPFKPHLWRVPIDGSHGQERVELAGANVSSPATTLLRDRLAFTRWQDDLDVYRFSLGHRSEPVASSSVNDFDPQFSPDGRRIALGSERSGKISEIWVAAADGTGGHRLTEGPGLWQGSPHWSPDGRRIAFDSEGSDGHFHVWTIDADGGAPHQVTVGPSDETVPTWSRDGRSIYFCSGRPGQCDIWRIPLVGGPNEQITRNGSGAFALESSDGGSLIYQLRREDDGPLVIRSLRDGSERQVTACAKDSAFDVGHGGVYYVACDPGTDPSVHVVNPVTGKERLLGTLERFGYPFPISLSVSPDETQILYVKRISSNADLMLIENFK